MSFFRIRPPGLPADRPDFAVRGIPAYKLADPPHPRREKCKGTTGRWRRLVRRASDCRSRFSQIPDQEPQAQQPVSRTANGYAGLAVMNSNAHEQTQLGSDTAFTLNGQGDTRFSRLALSRFFVAADRISAASPSLLRRELGQSKPAKVGELWRPGLPQSKARPPSHSGAYCKGTQLCPCSLRVTFGRRKGKPALPGLRPAALR